MDSIHKFWNTSTSVDIEEANPKFAVIPIGAFEQHGAHLPITTDSLIASIIGKALCDKYNGLLLSPITVSCSHEHSQFSGTISISSVTLSHVLTDLVRSIESKGIEFIVIVNGHGGNYVVNNLAQEFNVDSPRVFVAPGRHHWEAAIGRAGCKSSISEDMHGGELETSILLHAMPEVVRLDLAADHEATQRPFLTLFGMHEYTSSGIIGFPTRASAEKGRKLIDGLVSAIGNDLQAILSRIKV